MRLSICIPTYNRSHHLANCLESVRVSRDRAGCDVEVCVSDNASTDATEAIVRAMQERMPIVYHRNPKNLGIPRNFLNVVEMASGEFAWLLGDDDLLMAHSLAEICALIEGHAGVDFFYVNSFHLDTEYVLSFPQPFNTANLPDAMMPFSSWRGEGELPFLRLIDPKVSWDFLGGMFLSVFRRSKWLEHAGALSASALADSRTFSEFDNTFPHVKIFARAFSDSRAYFHPKPLSVCLTGAREWAPMYPFVRSVRLVEALDEFRRNGLSLLRYLRCRNFALRTLMPDLANMTLNKDISGYRYAHPVKVFMRNVLYPNSLLSVPYYFFRKLSFRFLRPKRGTR
ncbi:MAG: glycosyltransferase family 2 protein [Gemmatimonadaceae bacterium]|nr:glycosyltransferase family 2 protein [Gemmatimonadaceae bacterium]